MKTPPSRQAHLEFAERLVSGILQPVFRVNSNARLRSGNKLHAHLLALDRVARAKRRNAARRPESRHGRKRSERETPMNSNAQNALIVAGKSQKQKQCAIFSGPPPRRVNVWGCRVA